MRAGCLNSNDCFVVATPQMTYVWCGKGSTGDEREMAKNLASGKGETLMVSEGEEQSSVVVVFSRHHAPTCFSYTRQCASAFFKLSKCGKSSTTISLTGQFASSMALLRAAQLPLLNTWLSSCEGVVTQWGISGSLIYWSFASLQRNTLMILNDKEMIKECGNILLTPTC